ncbi:MAG: hypothetical protein ABSG24_06155 [Acidimicrobiales bacterium]
MNQNALVGPRETAQDVWDYLEFAGFHLTREQLVRIHQRRIMNEPFLNPSSWRDPRTTYAPGTAQRMLRMAQLKGKSKHLDELAWRLWWEGADIEPEIVRSYLTKMAKRWDERLSEFRLAAADAAHDEGLKGERDVLDDVFFKHLKPAPSMTSLRKRLGQGSDIYVEFAALLIDLLRGDFSVLGEPGVGLFGRSNDPYDEGADDDRGAGRTALEAMQGDAAKPYARLVESLNSRQIENARPVALHFTRIIANIGAIMHDGFGEVTRDRDTVGSSLVALAESPEEQVLSLLLTSSFLKDDRIRTSLSHLNGMITHSPAISYEDYLRLRYLAKEVPGMEDLVNPSRMRDAFDSPEGAERWRASFEEFRQNHLAEFEEAMAARPDLFALKWPGGEDFLEIMMEEEKSKKKN